MAKFVYASHDAIFYPAVGSAAPGYREQSETARDIAYPFSRFLIPVALVIFAVPFIALSFYASLATDDIARAMTVPNELHAGGVTYNCMRQLHTMTAVVWNEYSIGSGRWLTSMLENIALNKFNAVTSYGWMLLLVMLTNVAALWYFFSTFFSTSRTRALLAAGVFYAAWLASVVSPGDNVYWLTGAIEYQLSLSAMLVFAGVISKPKHQIGDYIVLAVLAIAIPAEHELAGVFLFVCLLTGLVTARALKQQTRQWMLFVGLVAFSLAVIILSPGMTSKMAQGHSLEGGYIARVLPYAKRAIHHGVSWTLSPAVLLSALCVPLLLGRNAGREGDCLRPRWIALFPLGAMLFLLAEFANSEMASGYGEFPARTVNWFQFVFWFLLVCAVTIGMPEISEINFSPTSRTCIFALLVISLLGSANFLSAERDVLGRAQPWWRANVARLKQPGSSMQFEPLPPRPALFIESGLSTNKGCWVNKCVALYVGANEVALKGPTENSWLGGCN